MNSSLSPFFRCFVLICIGPIPSEIVKLTNLQVLALSGNKLTGQYFGFWHFYPILFEASDVFPSNVKASDVFLFLWLFCLGFVWCNRCGEDQGPALSASPKLQITFVEIEVVAEAVAVVVRLVQFVCVKSYKLMREV